MDNASELALLDYLRVLRRRKWIVVLTLLVAVGTTLAISLTSPKVYAAESRIQIAPAQASADRQQVLLLSNAGRIDTEIQVLQSQDVEEGVAKQLGARASRIEDVTVTGVGATEVVRITVESTDPEVARDAANLYASVYEEQRLDDIRDRAVRVSEQFTKEIDELRPELDRLNTEIAAEQAKPKPEIGRIALLEEERAPLTTRLNTLQVQLASVRIDVGINTDAAKVLVRAETPEVPVRPVPLRNGVLAAVLGLVLGAGLAFLFEYLDDSVKTSDDLERHAAGLSLLGAIPNLSDWRNRDRPRLITVEHPNAPVSEAYRSLRTSIQFMALRQPLRTLAITSPMQSEGKTTTMSNLAVTIARSGQRVVVIDCDLRRPRLHDFFGLDNELGFTSLLLGEANVDQVLHKVPLDQSSSLFVVPSGPRPPNPSELLSSDRVGEVLDAIKEIADVVLLDTPPLLPVTDSLILSQRVDGMILVATSRVTGRRQLRRAVELLDQAEAPTLGVVLNGATESEGYGYAYRYAYRADDTKKSGKNGKNSKNSKSKASRKAEAEAQAAALR